MLNTIRDHAQGERLGHGYSVLERSTVDHNSGRIGNLCDKTAVILTVNFDLSFRMFRVPCGFMPASRRKQIS